MTKKLSDMIPKELKKHKADRDKRNAYKRKWAKDNPDKIRENRQRWIKNNPDKWKEILSNSQTPYYAKLKLDAMNAYGGPICVLCDETNIDKLSIDHSRGDGKEHREEIFGDNPNSTGVHFYKWLRDDNYPQNLGLRVLCMSCNAKEDKKDGLFRDCVWLYNQYITKGRTTADIGYRCGVSYKTVIRQLKDFSFPIRSRGTTKKY